MNIVDEFEIELAGDKATVYLLEDGQIQVTLLSEDVTDYFSHDELQAIIDTRMGPLDEIKEVLHLDKKGSDE